MSEESFSTKHKRMQREMVKQAYIWGIEMGETGGYGNGSLHGWLEEKKGKVDKWRDLHDLYKKLGIEE